MGGSKWVGYTEHYQWRPSHNSHGRQISVESGQVLHGSLKYSSGSDSYLLTQTNTHTGQSSSQTVKCQNGKKYNLPYVVYEKLTSCGNYPPDGKVVSKHQCRVRWERLYQRNSVGGESEGSKL